MPIYEYRCPKCGREFEELLRSDQDAPSCPACGAARCRRLLSACAVRTEDGGLPTASRSSGGCGAGGFT